MGRARGGHIARLADQGRMRQRWSDERIAIELRAFAERLGHRPTLADFAGHGRQSLLSAMNRHGGRQRFEGVVAHLPPAPDRRTRIGPLPGPRPGRRRWTPETVEADLRGYVEGMSHFPTAAQMERDGRADLRQAIRHHGGTKVWAARLSLPLRPGQDRSPYDADDAARDARRLRQRTGGFPA